MTKRQLKQMIKNGQRAKASNPKLLISDYYRDFLLEMGIYSGYCSTLVEYFVHGCCKLSRKRFARFKKILRILKARGEVVYIKNLFKSGRFIISDKNYDMREIVGFNIEHMKTTINELEKEFRILYSKYKKEMFAYDYDCRRNFMSAFMSNIDSFVARDFTLLLH